MWNLNKYSDNVALLSEDGITVTYSMLIEEVGNYGRLYLKSLSYFVCAQILLVQ